MDISNGFQIDNPRIFIPWNIDAKQLGDLFSQGNLKQVTPSYYTAACSSLEGLNCMIGFHFEPRVNGQLSELEFFGTNYDNQEQSFTEFQKYFEQTFGMATKAIEGSEGFNNYEWLLNKVRIIHLVYDRFGPEEHMRIKKIK